MFDVCLPTGVLELWGLISRNQMVVDNHAVTTNELDDEHGIRGNAAAVSQNCSANNGERDDFVEGDEARFNRTGHAPCICDQWCMLVVWATFVGCLQMIVLAQLLSILVRQPKHGRVSRRAQILEWARQLRIDCAVLQAPSDMLVHCMVQSSPGVGHALGVRRNFFGKFQALRRGDDTYSTNEVQCWVQSSITNMPS